MTNAPLRFRHMRRAAYGAAGGAGLALVAGAIVLGPAGPYVAAHLAQNQAVWRLGKLGVAGVTGSALGNLHVRRATLSDDRGVWAVAEDLTVAWEPLRLVFGDVALRGAHAQRLTILRQPDLGPDLGGGPVTVDAHIASIVVERAELAPGVAGPAAVFHFAGGAVTQKGGLRSIAVDLQRSDRPLDHLKIDYVRAPALTLDVDLAGERGGVFARLIGAPDSQVAASARTSVHAGVGALQFSARVDTRRVAHADLSWNASAWRLDGDVHLDALAAARPLAARFGPLLSFTAAGQSPRAQGAPFQATFAAADLSGSARGKVSDDLRLVDTLPFTLSAGSFVRLAPELGLQSGAAHFQGEALFASAHTRISGRLDLEEWRRDGFVFSTNGPVDISADRTRVSYGADLAAARVEAPTPVFARLLADPRVTVKGMYDRLHGMWRFDRLAAEGANFVIAGAGVVGAGQFAVKGDWRAPHLGAAFSDIAGAARGDWKLASAEGGAALDVSGGGVGVSGRTPLANVLGGAPKLAAKLRFVDRRAVLDAAKVEGRALRLGATGVLAGAPTDVRLEASARGPIDLTGMRLTGALDATGRVTGALDAPRVYAQAQFGVLDVAGARIENAKLTLDLVPEEPRARGGRIALTGQIAHKPLTADARVLMTDRMLVLDQFEARAAQLTGAGRVALGSNGPEANLHLAGALEGLAPGIAGTVDGDLVLTSPRAGTQAVALDATLKNARFGQRIVADTLTVHASGPLGAMHAAYAFKGWASEDPLTFSGEAHGAFSATGLAAVTSAKGEFAGAALSTAAPARVQVGGAGFDVSAALALGAGKANVSWRSDGARLSASGQFDRAPLPLLTAFFDQPLAGAVTGGAHLSGVGGALAGDVDLTLEGARLARRSRDSIDAAIKAEIGGGIVRGRIDVHAANGLAAHADGQAPIVAQAAPFRLAAASGGMGRAHWSVDGRLDGLWALFGPLDQSLAGRVDGAGNVQFGKGGLVGGGALTLADGAFEDKETGVKLHDIAARIAFDSQGLRLESFAATDGKDGRVAGSGRLRGPNDGELNLKLTKVRLIDRADAKAIGGGEVKVSWRDGGALLTGDIALDEADMRTIGSNAAATAPALDVIEINRPGPPPRLTRPASTIPAAFDLHIHAPGRVFTRTRGLDAEWSLDMRVRGDSKAPILTGSAQLVRGQFTLAGRPFALDSGQIAFTGAPEDAQVLLAATADAPNLTVHATVSGRALDPDIALTSDPALPEDEILPQLLFGSSSRDMSPIEAAQLAASLATLTGQSAFDVAGAARAAVDLDRLDIRQDSTGFLVAGGKYLNRDVYLEVARGSLGDTATTVQWQVRPRLFVISSFSSAGDQNLALRWKKDY